MAKWIGYAVSVNCGEPLGCYQGTILEADGSTITLTKAFRNGFPYPKSQVTLNAADIKELKIIESRTEPAEQTHSTVAVTKVAKKGPRATVCESLQANPTSSGAGPAAGAGPGAGPGAGRPRSRPVDIQRAARPAAHATHSGSGGGGGGGGGGERARRRNEACFGGDAVPVADDFDFEGNLALFDKQALWEQMRLEHKPDLVRQVDEGGKFRHDENVLGGAGGGAGGGARRGIRVPDALRGALDYVTDDGVVVPSLTRAARRRLWDAVWRLGLGDSALLLLARGAADVALRLVGGGRRLDPRNAHQTPAVVALLGDNAGGAAGAAAARLLAAHGARAAVHVARRGAAVTHAALRRELAAAALAGVTEAPLERLPSPDLVLVALHDERDDDHEGCEAEALAVRWARGLRAALVALEPGARAGALRCRAAVLALLPAALPAALGRVYLCNAAPPLAAFADLRVAYRAPFGAAAVLALHPADAADLADTDNN